MKNKLKKWMANILAVVMILSTVPAISFSALAQNSDNWRYLDELEWESAKSSWTNGEVFKNRNLFGQPLSLLDLETGEKREYEHGLFVLTPSEVTYDIIENAMVSFSASFGIDTAVGAGGHTQFQVYGDGELLFESDYISGADGIQNTGVIDLTGYQTLRLVANSAGADWAEWADAKVEIDENVLNRISKVDMNIDNSAIQIGEQAQVSVSVKRVSGEEAGLSELDSLRFSSDNEAVATVDENGHVSGVGDGIARIKAVAELDGVVREGVIMILVGTGSSEESWSVISPNRSNSIIFTQGEDGSVRYMAAANGKLAVDASKTGLDTSLGDFSAGLTYVGREDREIDETYDVISGKQSTFINRASESKLKFEKDGVRFNIIVRAYDDGVAFQYEIIGEDGQALVISGEDTTYDLPAGSYTYSQAYITNCYENYYRMAYVSELNGNYGWSFLYQTPDDIWVMLGEAKHTGEYIGVLLEADGSDELQTAFVAPDTPATTAPFNSPWRVMVLSTPEQIANTQIFENLSDPCRLEDTSWIEPGVTNWTWLNGDRCDDLETYKRYVDSAVEMGWTYVLMDEGWNIGGRDYDRFAFPDWYEELHAYAEEKGIKLLAWFHKNAFNTEEKRQRLIPMMKEAGIAGLKIDFFDGETQDQLKLYEALTELTAEYQLVVNFHGCNLPTGERRTWPHILNREGVFGAENKRPDAVHYNILPFTRNAVGPMDFTPLYSDGVISDAGHLATAITYESGIPCLAGKPAEYKNSAALDFFRNIPAVWDDSTVLEANPGEYYTVARRSGESWYVGGTTVNKRTAAVDLSFLGGGAYYAFIYRDGSSNRTILADTRQVTSEDVLHIDCLGAGGFGIELIKGVPTQAGEIILSDSELTMEVDSSQAVTAKLSPSGTDISKVSWISSDDSIATVDKGVITAHAEGTVTITAATGLHQDVTAECRVNVVKKSIVLYDNWSIIRKDANAFTFGGDSVTIWTQGGDMYGSSRDARNIFLTDPGAGDFVVTTKLHFAPAQNYQSAGLIVYAGDDALFTVLRRHHSGLGGKVIGTLNKNPGSSEQKSVEKHPEQDVYLKLEKAGSRLTGSYSYDNVNWTVVEQAQTNSSLDVSSVKVGLFAASGGDASSAQLGEPATFTEFKVNGEAVPFAYANSYETELNITDKVITDAPAETSAEAYKAMFDTTAPMSVTDKDGNELADDALVGTGCIVTVGTDVLMVVVPGDVDSDGKVGVMDLLTMKSGILGRIELADANVMAADRHADGVINIFDLVQLKLDILKG
ncbi:glycoside hydrolase family 97 catalytic domain-containing protein [Candidatus Soleaferrea massiliensis]|uniref:glycoside hydrolase family 97 catalytic domain-containing protein n=1 Tax=Candidatus Soleaferrea massiliensis TaxID=1470354 RepID=UPI0005912E8F|nr:glycoside hydrolase family 97 catalytic domain-containing protein [Candidatus Soleaferrea massiliensis]